MVNIYGIDDECQASECKLLKSEHPTEYAIGDSS